MALHFSVKTPFLDGDSIRKAHTQRRYLLAAYRWVIWPAGFVLLLAAISLVFDLVFYRLADVAPLLTTILGAPVLLVLFFGGLFGMASAHDLLKESLHEVTPPSPAECSHALSLAASHPGLEQYRKTIASSRKFTYGDVVAMGNFGNRENDDEACRALHDVS